MKKIIFVPADTNHIAQYDNLVKSIRKFHTEEDLPIMRVDNSSGDANFWYRAKPIIAKELINNYDVVIGMDCDQIVLGPLDELWEGEFDVAVVRNDPTYPIQVLDIIHPNYYNAGLVVMKSKAFIDHWYKLCFSAHFPNFQFREQDFLTLLASDYFNYKVKVLDGENIYGEFAKPLWAQFVLKDDKVVLANNRLMIIHFGGGAGDPSKGNYRIRFKPEVVEYIERMIE